MIKDFIPMECPVCHKYYFVDDTEDEKNEDGYEGKRDDYCSCCGWKYDLYQAQHPDVARLTNELSLNDYKKDYDEKIKINPNYDYLEEHHVIKPHLCPVCGKYEFVDVASFDICPYCGWEDDPLMEREPDYWGGANDLSLNDYKKDYEAKIKVNPNYKWYKK